MDRPTTPTTAFAGAVPRGFEDQPFYTETVTLLDSVRDHDLATLSDLCDDDFGIVDIDVSGHARPIRTRTEWLTWFRDLFATLDAMGAWTESTVLGYQAVRHETMGFSALDFRQTLAVGPHVATFDCVATIVWKLTAEGWREARWHASVISSDVPAELVPAA
ncbi:hypothetical protein ASG76_12345 [Nocardioides sp. Soil774]|uniref:nuclear transport factor 2 family protein n=1 Tax=Nocardioides sp. Soil774 TaxID=1736408 RepID=UPI0006FBBF1C|nr:nuclear transport factor 2 family protein [Nocardioides sp. Soil774]KRE94169.1 hypothetical protein ASG76_12345 [Nocardioides sp. Soil774]